MILLHRSVASFFILFAFTTHSAAQENSACITHQDLVRTIAKNLEPEKNKAPEFRINKADDGQSLVYWHTGGETGSFFAATFKSDGCAVLTSSGELRRFTFPKTAFNTGVFFEMEKLDYKL